VKTRLFNLWQRLRASYWFLPSLLTLAALVLALAMVTVDERFKRDGLTLPPGIYKGGPEGARAVLSTVAGSMISVTGITFSITIVALTLASSQFGPRLLKNFMRDTGNQVVLGVFLATFVYCLMVLRRVHGTQDQVFVPHLSVTLGIGLALGSVGVLIYFIDHVAQSIQAENVIAAVGRDLDSAIERFYPETIGTEFKDDFASDQPKLPGNFQQEAVSLRASRTGYVQAIEGAGLMRLAKEHDLIVRVDYKPGDYVIAGSPLVQVWPAERADEKLAEKFNNVFILGNQRTGEQDAEFAAHQLVEVALRALSPGINDTFTAINCIDRLGASLAKLAERAIPPGLRYDEENHLRVVTDVDSFKGILNAAFDQIRQNGRTNAAVTIRLLEVIREIALHVHRQAHRAALLRQTEMIERGSRNGLPEEEDRKDVQTRYQEALKALPPKA
jgi:uncharacterized membrane protein